MQIHKKIALAVEQNRRRAQSANPSEVTRLVPSTQTHQTYVGLTVGSTDLGPQAQFGVATSNPSKRPLERMPSQGSSRQSQPQNVSSQSAWFPTGRKLQSCGSPLLLLIHVA